MAVGLVSLCLAGPIIVSGQAAIDAKVLGQLQRLFPSAATFSPKSGSPPHFTAYLNDGPAGAPRLLGFAFWTTELEPLERGYDGPIKILVGLDVRGVLTGIVVADHHEPYGYFSVDPPGFAAQFAGKPITDRFAVGADIDAVSRASISITSASRAVRNSARRIAKALLPQPPPAK
jgi:NosR/NirI family nitrous oxide reductase transcriptional regulator